MATSDLNQAQDIRTFENKSQQQPNTNIKSRKDANSSPPQQSPPSSPLSSPSTSSTTAPITVDLNEHEPTSKSSGDKAIQLSDFIGSYGTYQFCLTALLFARNIFLGLMASSGPLMTPDVTFYCQLPMAEVLSIMPNISLMNPQERDLELKEEFKRVCQLDLNLYHNFSSAYSTPKIFPALMNSTDVTSVSVHQHQRECTDFTYELTGDHGRTMTSEFDLVCERDWLRSLYQSLLSASIVVAHVFWGTFSDKYGRFQAQRLCWLISLVSGFGSVFATEFWTFVLLRALCSFGDLGLVVSLTTTVVELVGNQYRGISVALVNFGYALGVTVLPYIMAYFEDFRYVIAFSVLCHLMTMPFLFTCNESIRWLCTNRRFKAAKRELKRISRWNRRSGILYSVIVKFLTCGCSTRSELKTDKRDREKPEETSKHFLEKDKVNHKGRRRLDRSEFEYLFAKLVDQLESQNLCEPEVEEDDNAQLKRNYPSMTSDSSDLIIKEGYLATTQATPNSLNPSSVDKKMDSTLSIELQSPIEMQKLGFVHTRTNSESGDEQVQSQMRATVIMDDNDGVHRYYTTGLVVGYSQSRDKIGPMFDGNNSNTLARHCSRVSLPPLIEANSQIGSRVSYHRDNRSINLYEPKLGPIAKTPKATSCFHLNVMQVAQESDWKTLTLPKPQRQSLDPRLAFVDIYRKTNADLDNQSPPSEDWDGSYYEHTREYHLRDRQTLCQQPDCINIVAHQLSFVGRVSRLFKDKKLMIAVFTIVWTTFNSELQYTSYIIINLEAGEDIYFNYVLGGCMEALAAICASLLLSYAPRRLSLITFWLLISFSCFGLSIAHIDSTWAVSLLALAKFSQSCLSSIACVAAYETFPTFLRQSGSGLVFTLGMLGSVFAPLIFAEFDDHAGMDRVLMTFSFSSLTAATLIYLFLNETRNCELQ